jgi:hypothetical protein
MAIEGMKLRGWKIKDLQTVVSEYRVKRVGATLAAVVLWGESSSDELRVTSDELKLMNDKL